MLTLNRKADESIIIKTPSGENIKIHLLSISRSQSRIGIDAPKDYLILRDELIETE